MSNKLRKYIATTLIAASLTINISPVITAYANADVTITGDTTSPTNKDLLFTITATDVGSGVKEIIIPNAANTGTQVVPGASATYTATKNGTYVISVKDNAGNITTGSVVISSIDKVVPVITVAPYNTDWTNQNIIVNVTTSKGVLNKTSHTFTSNDTFTFSVNDPAGNSATKAVKITNIDKTPPSTPIYVRSGDVATLTQATDNESGIAGHDYKIDSGDWNSSVNIIDLKSFEDGTYIVQARATDKAGNVSSAGSLEVHITYTAEATEAVVKAEGSLLEADYSEALSLVNDLASGSGKASLQDRLAVLRGHLDSVIDIISEIEVLTTIDVDWTNVNKIRADISNLPSSPVKTTLSETLENKVKEIMDAVLITAEEAVSKAEGFTSVKDYTDALTLVNNLPTCTEKEEFISRLEEVKRLYDEALAIATDAVIKAEDYLTRKDYTNALALVNSLPIGNDKTLLKERLDEVDLRYQTDLTNATNSVLQAEKKIDREDLVLAQTLVKELPEGSDKEGLNTRLLNLELEIKALENAATAAVVKSEEYKSRQDYHDALILVNSLPKGDVKTALNGRLDTLEEKYQADLIKATAAVEKAEEETERLDYQDALDLVNSLPVGVERTELEGRLDVVNSNYLKKLEDAEESVSKAESYLTRQDYLDAIIVVDLLPNGEDKDNFNSRLEAVNAKYNEDVTKATDAVLKAEEYLTRKDYTDALDLVNSLPLGTERTELEDRLNDIELKYQTDLAEATTSVEQAEKQETRKDYTDALDLVSNLPTGIDKTSLENRLADVEVVYQENLTIATNGVIKAEEGIERQDYFDAIPLVNSLPTGQDKTDLIDRLQAVEDKFQQDLIVATEAVEEAEATISKSDILYAKNKVSNLPNSVEKTELEERLEIVQEEYDKVFGEATEAVEKAEENLDREDYNNAKDLVEKLPAGEDKNDLEDRLEVIEDKYKSDLKEAVEAVEKAEEYISREDYTNAKDIVDLLPKGQDKTDLEDRLQAVEDKYQDDLSKATEAVEKVENKYTHDNFDNAQSLVNKLPTGQDKSGLQDRLDKVKSDYEDLLGDATEAVEKAEEGQDILDIDNARDKVYKLPECQEKDDLTERLDNLEAKYNDDLKKATEAVEKAEETLKREDYNTALDLVNKLPNGPDKIELLDRLEALLKEIKKKESESSSGNEIVQTPVIIEKPTDNKEAEVQAKVEQLTEELFKRMPFTIPIGEFNLKDLIDMLDQLGINYEGIPEEKLVEIATGVQTLELKIGDKVMSQDVEGVDVRGKEAVGYKDITTTHWAHDTVNEATSRGLLVGTSEGVYSPKSTLKFSDTFVALNRVMMKNNILVTNLDRQTVEEMTKELSKDHWSYYGVNSIISRLQEDLANDITKIGSQLYNQEITRGKLAETLYSISNANPENYINKITKHADMTNDQKYAIYCTEEGLMVGYDDTTFKPNNPLSRAELAAVLVRLDNLLSRGE